MKDQVNGALLTLQVVPSFSGAKQVMTSDIIKCTFIPFPGLQIKRAILSTCLSFQQCILSYPIQKRHEVRKRLSFLGLWVKRPILQYLLLFPTTFKCKQKKSIT